MGEDNFLLRGNLSNTFSALTLNNKLIKKEDVIQQIEDQQQEIMQLRRHLAEYAVKEARIQTEKNVLENRIDAMHKGFDKQQQDFIEARSKAMAYKQDIMEDNIRLGYALKVAQEEDSIFISSLVPLLAEQSLYPASHDAYSIVSNLRILFKHHQERLVIAEEQLRDSQYHQPLILHSSPKPVHIGVKRQDNGEEAVNSHYLPSIIEEEQEQEPSSSSHPEADDESEENDNDNDNESDDYDEVDTNKPLPTIEDLQITGDPFPGNQITAKGYSRNGTTRCGFEWVRYLQDGSMTYIEGAKHPTYIVTADDIDNYLAVIVQPLDDKQRKGEVVKCFANDNKKITCDPDMLREIENKVSVGHASFKLFVLRGSLQTWEPAILEIKKSGYSIKLDGPNKGAVVVNDKYTPPTVINLPAEQPLQFSILGHDGVEQYLYADYNSTGISCSRDAIVLMMRLFVKQAVDKMLGKKKRRVLFFK